MPAITADDTWRCPGSPAPDPPSRTPPPGAVRWRPRTAASRAGGSPSGAPFPGGVRAVPTRSSTWTNRAAGQRAR